MNRWPRLFRLLALTVTLLAVLGGAVLTTGCESGSPEPISSPPC